ncbi:MAG TPA: hypothetical protein VFH04_04080 [Nitrososphaeraceae archaeon]|nr:hypothetical protein [Nitrososphaeraceae archaeon]
MRLLNHGGNFISKAKLEDLQTSPAKSRIILFRLSFSIGGTIRSAFNQACWERAYKKHDNSFRVKIRVVLKMNDRNILEQEFIRKAVIFWTRNPKIPFKIWVFIIQEDVPMYPLSIQEVQSLMFDVNKTLEINGNELEKLGHSRIHADVRVSWGRHDFTEPVQLSSKSNSIRVI